MKKIFLLLVILAIFSLTLISAGVLPPPFPPSDSDNDGVPDSQDSCPDTEAGQAVDSDGCSILQLCPEDGDWRNHGQYVSCVARTSENFLEQGLITEEQKDAIVSEAARSEIGK